MIKSNFVAILMLLNYFSSTFCWECRNNSLDSISLLNFTLGEKILLFGDSLTHGQYILEDRIWNKAQVHPYALRLTQRINSSETIVLERGQNAQAASGMMGRLKYEINYHHVNLSLVVILAGTNDFIRHNFSADPPEGHHVGHLLKYVTNLHDFVRSFATTKNQTIITMAVTIPQYRAVKDVQADPVRHLVNQGIRNYTTLHRNSVALLDIESLFNQNNTANDKYWSPDFVHFSIEGYDMIGDMVYDVMKQYFLKLG